MEEIDIVPQFVYGCGLRGGWPTKRKRLDEIFNKYGYIFNNQLHYAFDIR